MADLFGQSNLSSAGTNKLVMQSTSGSGSNQSSTAQQGMGSSATAAQNTYLPWQSGLQQQAGQAAGDFLNTGALPAGFQAAQQQQAQAYTDNYNRFVAPVLAAQGGAGSPAIGSNLALGLEQLQANLYVPQLSAYQGGISQAGQLGFQPVGTTGQQQQQQQATSDTTGSWQEQLNQLQNMAVNAYNYDFTRPFRV